MATGIKGSENVVEPKESLLVEEVNKLLKKSKKSISESTSKDDLQHLIAVATENLERHKAIQVTIFFVGLILSIMIATFVNYYGRGLASALFIIVTLLVSSLFLENRFKNGVGKAARLREMLIFLEKNKEK